MTKEFKDVDLDLLSRTIDDIFSLNELREKLKENRQLTIKFGADATAPFLHIGHAVNLWMMRHFQECGHKVIFLVGDFTTRIGDPSGKSKTRKVITQEEIDANAEEFIRQVGQVLLTDPKVFEVRRNSEWFDKMPTGEFLSIISLTTHAKLISRDMFQKRLKNNHEIHTHELIYPIIQGYDSVALKADIAMAGTDQLFNELMGRFYQEKFDQKPQVVITSKITPGIDGGEKQSKSLGNFIALEDSPRDKFGKIMSIPDKLIIEYLKVYTEIDMQDISSLEKDLSDGKNPIEVKKILAKEVVRRYHGEEEANNEKSWFESSFSKKEFPDDAPVVKVAEDSLSLLDLLIKCDSSVSKSEMRRLIKQNAISINGEKHIDEDETISIDKELQIQIGKKKWFKVKG
jgi:tyrosyl-tRNA synthetase